MIDRELSDLDRRVIEILREDGIDSLYPPQKEAIPLALAGEDLVLSVPTAGGKSLVAYLGIVNKLLKEGGKALYIVPLKALAREKYEDLLKFRKLGLKVAISTGDLTRSDPKLARYDIIVCTSEKADSLIRHGSRWLSSISIVVADEIHLLNDPGRGPTLEVVISRLKKINPNMQVIALSATIRNAEDIAGWLNARLIKSEWRPVKLKEGVYYRGVIEFSDGSVKDVGTKPDPISALVSDCLEDGGQVLIFVNTRKSSASLAKKLRSIVKKHLKEEEVERLKGLSEEILSMPEETTSLDQDLSNCVGDGTAFHHAGLSSESRKIIENAFRERLIKCIVATPTLAAGVNIPARRVIIRDLWRYEFGIGMYPIPVLEYKQQAGRAGRPRYDKEGEAITIAKDKEQRKRIIDNYIFGEPEPVYSKLGSEPMLRFHVLSSIASGFTPDRESLFDFFSSTFYAYQSDISLLEDVVEDVLRYLEDNNFIEDFDGRLKATLFGEKTSKLYLDPLTALHIKRAIERASPDGEPEISYLQAICYTPDMKSLYLRGDDVWIEERLEMIKKHILVNIPPIYSDDYEIFLSSLKTAHLLQDWIEEVPEAEICSRYGVGPGDIRNIIETAEWLLYSMRELARIYRFDLVRDLNNLLLRVKYGCKKELLDLVKLRGIGRVRARALYKAGFKTINSLRGVPLERLVAIPSIGKKIALSIKKQIGEIDNKMVSLE